jgi:hypothetical protein
MPEGAGFVQIIEIVTQRLEEVQALVDSWAASTEGRRSARRAVFTVDRDHPNTYVQMVEFPSYEAAMANSALPETAGFAEQLVKLCDQPPSFRNLDVIRVEEM